MTIKKISFIAAATLILFTVSYYAFGLYLASTILTLQDGCGSSTGFTPSAWNTQTASHSIDQAKRKTLYQSFDASPYLTSHYETVSFPARNDPITLSGWWLNPHPEAPTIIIVHGIFPNGKCGWPGLMMGALLNQSGLNALIIDQRGYGQSERDSNYESLGVHSYKDVLGAFDYLQTRGLRPDQIGALGISLGSSAVIFALEHEPKLKAAWLDTALARIDWTITDELGRYGLPNVFGPALRWGGQTLTGIDIQSINPMQSLQTGPQAYYLVHGTDDQRIYYKHARALSQTAHQNGVDLTLWTVPSADHIDPILMHTQSYQTRLAQFFYSHLKQPPTLDMGAQSQ